MADAVASSRVGLQRLPYRADVDGLRAIAVGLVVAFHFGVPGFSGGYIGVDLFFVISGFLIASIFARQPRMTGADLIAFFARRLKRLMPAFLFVALVTVAIGAALLLPEDLDALLKSIRESLATRANLFFERETTGYFAATAGELPWLHTWSLSVEWQFYFLFPLVAVALRGLPSPRSRATASWLLAGLGVALSIAMVDSDPSHAYFSAPARFFEFFLGALAASVRVPALDARWARPLSAAGVVALLVLANRFTAATPFPGVAAVAVCVVGFGLVAYGGRSSILANASLAAVGRRSYSIYLWHWPVVAMLAYVQHRPSALEIAVWCVAIYAAADATWRWVERPGIALRWPPLKAFALIGLLPFAVVASTTAVVRSHAGFPQRLGPEARHAADNIRRQETRDADRCHDYRGGDLEACAFGADDPTTRALLIGDSHARHFRPFLQVLASDAHVRAYGLTDSECLALEGAATATRASLRTGCINAVARDFALIRGGRFRYVVLGERWIGYQSGPLASLDEALATIVAAGAIPVLFLSAAEDGTNTRDCFWRPIKTRDTPTGDCAIRADNDYARPAKGQVAALIDAMRRKYPTLRLIDPQAVQCRDGRCVTEIDRTPIYTDLHHLNAFGSTSLAEAYLQRIGNPLR